MTASDIIMTGVSVGGFSGITMVFVLKAFLENGIKELIKSAYNKQLENHKFILRNSEKVFQYKLDASKSLYKILNDIVPERRHPDMDWEDASEEIASNFKKHEQVLHNFLCEYQATLSKEILERVRHAISACSDGQFEFYWDSKQQDAICTRTARDKASELYDALAEAVEMLRDEVHNMISVPGT